MAVPDNPSNYFKESLYICDTKIYREYMSEVDKLNPQERKQRLNILNSVLEDINEALKLPVIILSALGTVVGLYIKTLENDPVFYFAMGSYLAIAAIILLLKLKKTEKKKVLFGLYRTVLLEVMGNNGELKTKYEGQSTLTLGVVECRIVNDEIK